MLHYSLHMHDTANGIVCIIILKCVKVSKNRIYA